MRAARVLGAMALAAAAYAAGVALAVPDAAPLAAGTPLPTSYMRLRAAERGQPSTPVRAAAPVPVHRMSALLVCAVVKAEDRTFFRHGGVLWNEVPGLAADALRGRDARGGSTITQQLARNLYLSPRRTPHRKLREAAIATELESALDKGRILEVYLNVIEWGDGVWGAEAASRHYLGQGAAAADPFEAAFLASLVAAPRRPLRGANAARAQAVQRRVLRQLRTSGLLDEREMRGAWSRSDTLFAALARDESLASALERARARPALASGWRPPPVDRVLADGCGVAHELAAEEL